MRLTLVVALAVALAAFTYLYLERLGRRGVVPLVCRAAAWSALGLLLLNLSCPVAAPQRRPLVLLDGSISQTAAGGRWREARDSAARWGDVRLFGDERSGADTAPDRGRSLLAPALLAASASDRPVIVVTDGEIEDARDVPPDLLARTSVRLFPRASQPDVAITGVKGPARITSGDSLVLEAEVQAVGAPAADSAIVALDDGTRRLARRTVRLGAARAGRVRLAATSAGLPPGDHVLQVALVDQHDAEPRTDRRLHLVSIVPTPGIVVLAGPTDWDTRFLYRALKDVAQLPVRGYARLEADRWRSLQDLALVGAEQVRQAARRADVVVLKGNVDGIADGGRARGVWRWPSGETSDGTPTPGDWYLMSAGASPVAEAFAGFPVDSFPPAVQLTELRTPPADWIALSAQDGRRGPQWPAVVGRDLGRTREVTVFVDGLWRWAFRGGSSEQSYRAWVAATLSWLLAGVDSAQGVARPVRGVVSSGRPLVFEWIGPGAARPVPIQWTGGSAAADTLRFDGAGRATVWLPPGEYRYKLGPGGTGTVAVEQYSDELLPHPVSLTPHDARAALASTTRSAREWPWLFALCVLGLAGEWVARRRLGLR
ncbi:MAG TPA: hypothetical protein VIE46_05745 [Gemmatimonadales bacterium]